MKLSIQIEGEIPSHLEAIHIVLIAPGEGPITVQTIESGKKQDKAFEAELEAGYTFAVRQIEKSGE